jgi:hypothetical protein
MCDSPLERGGGVCPLRQVFTLLHGGEHTPATTLSGTPPLKRGSKISGKPNKLFIHDQIIKLFTNE